MTEFEIKKENFNKDFETFLTSLPSELTLNISPEMSILLTDINDEKDLENAKTVLYFLENLTDLLIKVNEGELDVPIQDNFYIKALIDLCKILNSKKTKKEKLSNIDELKKELEKQAGYIYVDMLGYALSDIEEVYEYICENSGMDSTKETSQIKINLAMSNLRISPDQNIQVNEESISKLSLFGKQINERLNSTAKQKVKIINHKK